MKLICEFCNNPIRNTRYAYLRCIELSEKIDMRKKKYKEMKFEDMIESAHRNCLLKEGYVKTPGGYEKEKD